MSIKLSELIAPVYADAHRDIQQGKHVHYWFGGGRASCKSSFVSLELLLQMLQNPELNALVLRRNANTIALSVYDQIQWAIDRLDLGHMVTMTKAPPAITFNGTGQKIIFRGLDDPLKLKSIKTRRGYFGLCWFEETPEMYPEDVRSVLQSVMRGGNSFRIFYSFNPPKMASNWVNQEFALPHPNKYTQKTTYLDIPREWLGDAFFAEAARLKASDPLAYANEYLGEVTGGGGQIFNNLELREIGKEELQNCVSRWCGGVDFGFAISPLVVVICGYDKTHNSLYVIDEVFGRNISNETCALEMKRLIRQHQLRFDFRFICDCAEPKSIDYLRRENLPVKPCIKGADSIRYGVKSLQSLTKIIVDPVKCPNGARQISNYEYQRNRAGEWVDEYPLREDDFVDAIRYATSDILNAKYNTFGI